MDKIGKGLTIMLIVSQELHELISIPVTIYEVLVIGLAETTFPVFELSELDGSQLYWTPPVAVKIWIHLNKS